MAEEFTGFANAPVDKKGKRLDFRSVKDFVDESDEGKVAEESRRTASTIVTGRENADGEVTAPTDSEEKADIVADANTTTDAKAAGGKGASGS